MVVSLELYILLLWMSGVTALALFAAVRLIATMAKRRGKRPTLLLPRYFLLLGLHDQLAYLPRILSIDNSDDSDESQWTGFCNKLYKKLKNIEEAIPQVTFDSQSPADQADNVFGKDAAWSRAVCKLAGVFDQELVPFLQEYPGMSELLSEYLPKPTQTWDSFLETRTDPADADTWNYLTSELGANVNHDDEKYHLAVKAFREELVSSLRHLVEQLKTLSETFSPTDDTRDGELEASIINYTIVKILYATDRQVTVDAEYVGAIGKRASRGATLEGSASNGNVASAHSLHFGVVEVGVPATHTTGTVEKAYGREDADPMKHVLILSVDTKLRDNSDEFVKMVNYDLDCLKDGSEKEVLVFIHGYNATHKGIVKTAAQLKYDLNFAGVVVAYSWSSKGELAGYLHDEKSAERTVPCLESFLWLITKEFKSAQRIHILAHSMGNRPVIRALTTFYEEDKRETRLSCKRTPLSQIILAAADEDRRKVEVLLDLLKTPSEESTNCGRELTEQTTNRVENGSEGSVASSSSTTGAHSPHVTVYCATDDVALHASKTLHRRVRLGDTYSFLNSNSDRIADHDTISDVVDASGLAVKLWQLGHSYYGSAPKVVEDIRVLLKERQRADKRRGLRTCTVNGKKFYAFNEKKWSKKSGCI